jgi:hypothetical protein
MNGQKKINNEKLTLNKYSRIFMARLTHLAWNTNSDVNKYLEGIQGGYTIEQFIGGLKDVVPLEDLKKLRPVRKIKIVG